MDALVVGSREVPAAVDTTFSWYFRDEDRWLTIESCNGKIAVKPGLTHGAEMRFYSSCVADFIHQHSTEGAGRAIFQGGGFYWRGDINRLKAISPLCRSLFGPRLHQRLVGAGINVPKFEVRRYPARTKAQRDRILAEWMHHVEALSVTRHGRIFLPPPVVRDVHADVGTGRETMVAVAVAGKAARTVKTAKTVKKTLRTVKAAKTVKAPRVVA
jgi:hypothetical protein